MDIKHLRKIAKSIVSEDGTVKPFDEQLRKWGYGEISQYDVLVVMPSSDNIPNSKNMPVIIKQANVRKIRDSHEISLTELEKLPKWIDEHVLALDSISPTSDNAIVLVTPAIDINKHPIIIALQMEKTKQTLIVHEVASVHGRKNLANLITRTHKAGLNLYPNEKTSEWLKQSGIQFPAGLASHLQEQCSKFELRQQGVEPLTWVQNGDSHIAKVGNLKPRIEQPFLPRSSDFEVCIADMSRNGALVTESMTFKDLADAKAFAARVVSNLVKDKDVFHTKAPLSAKGKWAARREAAIKKSKSQSSDDKPKIPHKNSQENNRS